MILRDVMRRRGFALIATVVVALVLAPCQIRAQIQKEASKAAANEMPSDRTFLEWLDALKGCVGVGNVVGNGVVVDVPAVLDLPP